MHADQQRALIRRALDLIARGASEAGEPARSPVTRYLDADRFERELEHVFRRQPVAVCPSASLAPGESLAMEVARLPLLLVRDAALDLDRLLGRFAQDLRSWGYDRWVPFHQREFANAANWKVSFEGNLETYHFQYAHRDTIAGLFHDNLLIADHDGPHHRIVLPKRSMAGLREQPESDWNLGRHSNIIYCFFPATFVLHEGDHANVFTVLPETVGTSRVLGTTLIPEPPATEKARVHWQKNVDSFWGALDEDFALGASVQSTLASGANRELLFGANEWCSAKFHADVEALLEAAAAR
jgi:phenylpropionate dioxygenase-like ring-hydroxylating dioxygenase large terminal subunit